MEAELVFSGILHSFYNSLIFNLTPSCKHSQVFFQVHGAFRRCCSCCSCLSCFEHVSLWQEYGWMCADICNSDLCFIELWLNLSGLSVTITTQPATVTQTNSDQQRCTQTLHVVKLIKPQQQLFMRRSLLPNHSFHQFIASGNEFYRFPVRITSDCP